MDKDSRRVDREERDWAAIVKAQASSQQTAADFCREQDLSYSTFLYHRSKIQKRASSSAIVRSTSGIPAVRPPGFIRMQVEGCSNRLCFPGGVVLESDQLPEAGWVVEVAAGILGKECSC
jgi:hypothetical protein